MGNQRDLPNYDNQQGLIKLLGLQEEDFRRQDQSMSEVSEEETPASPTKTSELEQTLPPSEIPKEETPASPVKVSELERILPPEEDFKMYCGRRIHVHFFGSRPLRQTAKRFGITPESLRRLAQRHKQA
jgi:hypothetical protein